MNENRFVCVGQVSSIREEEFNQKIYVSVELLFNETTKGYFRFEEKLVPEGTKFMSTLKLSGYLHGRAQAKISPKGVSYVAETTGPVVQQVELVK